MIKRNKKGIKICRVGYDNELTSCFIDGMVTKYKKRRWTKRPENCGPLAIFNTIESAIYFIRHHGGLHNDRNLYLCKYKESKEKLLYKQYATGKISTWKLTPEGTIFADEVKIIKELKIK